MSERGAWIEGKARGLLGMIPGAWEEHDGVMQGRCPGEAAHTGASAATDARVYLSYGPGGQPPGVYCLHHSCKGVLDEINGKFRDAIFARDDATRPQKTSENGVVRRAPVAREPWIPSYDEGLLKTFVASVPEVGMAWFEARSAVDVRDGRVSPGQFIEHVFGAGERVLIFSEVKSKGDYLWEVGRGGYRLAAQRGVAAVRSKIPVDGGVDGMWYLSNPVDGQWYANPRRGGQYSRRSKEAVTRWRYYVLESDDAPEGLWLRFLAMQQAIVAIYSSGGRSWHALVRVDLPDKASFDTFLREAKRILPIFGADPGAMTPVRLTRLPGCTRGGKSQRLIYLNPKVAGDDKTRIRDRKAVRA
jgi:hypothetical protein